MSKPCDECEAARDGKCYVRAEKQPVTTEFVADGVWVNMVQIEGLGTTLPQHAHAHEHATAIAKGGVRIERDDMDPIEIWAPDVITIPARVKHLFVTLTDEVTMMCIHRIDRAGAVEIAAEHQLEFV